MSDLFREVDEALQKEKMEKLWKDYGHFVIIAIGVLILSTAATTAWQSWNHHRHTQETAKLAAVLEDENPADKLMEIASDTRGGQETVALMSAAGLKADKGDSKTAGELYRRVYESSRAPDTFRHLARVLAVRVQMGEEKPDGAAMMDILSPVLKDTASPWTWAAKLDAAVIEANVLSDPKKALETLSAFDKAEGIPVGLKDKAIALKQVYAADVAAPAAGE